MKLAEALLLRADCQKRMEQLKSRLIGSAKLQEGEVPPENPQKLLAEVEAVADQLMDLIRHINRTNSTTPFVEGKSIADALAERDVLLLRRGVYNDLATFASVRQDRITRSEVKYISAVDVSETRKRADELAKNYRELDARIQELNWKTELID
ncbi:MAG TPA: DIP1984 family protein [Pyrinomonadaceae bacterium]|jgi:hypothetical protein